MSAPVAGLPKFQLKEPVQSQDKSGITSVTATFSNEGKNYTVTISYNKQSIQSSYGTPENEIDARIKAVFDQLDPKELSLLSGVSIQASLSDLKNSIITKKSETVANTLGNLEGQPQYSDLCKTALKIISVFSQQIVITKKEEEEKKKKKADLDVKVDPVPIGETKKPADFTFQFEEVKEDEAEAKKDSPVSKAPQEGEEVH